MSFLSGAHWAEKLDGTNYFPPWPLVEQPPRRQQRCCDWVAAQRCLAPTWRSNRPETLRHQAVFIPRTQNFQPFRTKIRRLITEHQNLYSVLIPV